MRKVGIKKLSKDAFERYGSYASIMEPEGDFIGSSPVIFYRDMFQQSLGCASRVSYSACIVEQRPNVIDCTESHDYCHETIICLDGDYLMHVAPASQKGNVPFDDIEVFLIPKGTAVSVKAGVWHQAGFPYKCDVVHILCALPERTYAVDCDFVEIPKDKQIEVVDEMI
jgi:ureidoglycolate lyase